MGRKALFNQEQIFETADTLAAQGKEVTAKILLDVLGGGSLTTIYRHLIAWQDARPDIGALLVHADIPASVQNAFATAWRTATTEAVREVNAMREKATEDVKAAHKQFHEALEQIERLESESDADAQRIESLTAAVSKFESSLNKLHSELAAEKAKNNQLCDQWRSQESEIARLRMDKDNAANDAAELRGQNHTLKEQNKELLSRLPNRMEILTNAHSI